MKFALTFMRKELTTPPTRCRSGMRLQRVVAGWKLWAIPRITRQPRSFVRGSDRSVREHATAGSVLLGKCFIHSPEPADRSPGLDGRYYPYAPCGNRVTASVSRGQSGLGD